MNNFTVTDEQLVELVAHVEDTHEFDYDGCHPIPRVHCWPWCPACKTLAGIPADLLDAGQRFLAACADQAAIV
jgi:hypothetical protein